MGLLNWLRGQPRDFHGGGEAGNRALGKNGHEIIGVRAAPFPEYEFHPICLLLQPLSDVAFDALASSIGSIGLRDAITLFEGKILDGRHRYLVCRKLGITPRFETFEGPAKTAIELVLARSVSHRPMSTSARAMLVARVARDDATVGDIALIAGVGRQIAERTMTIARRGDPELIEMVCAGKVSVNKAYQVVVGKLKRTELFIDRRRTSHLHVVEGARASA